MYIRYMCHLTLTPQFVRSFFSYFQHPFDGPLEDLLNSVETNMANDTILSMPCGRVSHIFTKQIEKRVKAQKKKKARTKTEL